MFLARSYIILIMKKGRRWLKKHVKLILAAWIFLMVAVAGIVTFSELNKPSAGTIQAVKPALAITKTASGLISRQGTYISFSYPASYSSGSPSSPGGTMVESFSLANRSSIPLSDINISILTLPSGLLADDGSYHFRLLNPSTYQPVTWDISGNSVPIMSDVSGGYGKVAFLVHGKLVAEVSASSGSSINASQLDNDLATVLTSLKWLRNG